MLYPVVIVVEMGIAQISGGSHGGAPCAPADHLRPQMVYCHRSFTSFGCVAKCVLKGKNHIDRPKRGWLMWFFALELDCHEKL